MRLTFLGTGTSHGVPMIGCRCAVCTSSDPRNHRRRASILVEWRETVIVVDTGPEFRLQAIDARVDRLDAVLLTHAHSDHVMGLDDVRAFNISQSGAMPVYGSDETLAEVRHRFAYAFREGPLGGGKPQLDLREIAGPFTVGELDVVPFELRHGPGVVTAFRFSPHDGGGPAFAYATDTNGVPEAAVEALGGLDLLVLDALGPGPHPTHYSIAEAVAMAGRISARRTLFTHMSHALDHEATCASLPPGMALAFDRQVVLLGGRVHPPQRSASVGGLEYSDNDWRTLLDDEAGDLANAATDDPRRVIDHVGGQVEGAVGGTAASLRSADELHRRA